MNPSLRELVGLMARSRSLACVKRFGWRESSAEGLTIRGRLACGHAFRVEVPPDTEPTAEAVFDFLRAAPKPCTCVVFDREAAQAAAQRAAQQPPPLTDVLIAAVWAAAYTRHGDGASVGSAVAAANEAVARLKKWADE